MSFDLNNLPKKIVLAEEVTSYAYMHAADLVIDHTGRVLKDREGKFGMARRDELDEATLVTKEMAKEAAEFFRERARAIVDLLLEGRSAS